MVDGYTRPKRRVRSAASAAKNEPKKHRTIDRVTRILEEVVYNPGLTFIELVNVLEAAKSSVHGFIGGLLASGWLHADEGRYYLGPAVYGLTLASGHIRAGLVTHDDIRRLHEESGFAAVLGVRAGDHMIYVDESGTDPLTGFDARTNIRRQLLATAGGKALIAEMSDAQRESFLRRHNASERELVLAFLGELAEIRRSRIAINARPQGSRLAIASAVHNRAGDAVAAIILVGEAAKIKPKIKSLSKLLLRRIQEMEARTLRTREAI